MSLARRPSAYTVLCGVVVVGIAGLCGTAFLLGRRRFDDDTFYFYELRDVGHPGIINVIASMGFICTAVLSVVLAMITRRPAWVVNACLFAIIAADNLLRLHNKVPSGDITVRLFYWIVLAWLMVRLQPFRAHRQGFPMLVVGLAALGTSELMDVVGPERSQRWGVLEESLGCLGAWCLVLATVGVAVSMLVVRSDAAAPPSGLESAVR